MRKIGFEKRIVWEIFLGKRYPQNFFAAVTTVFLTIQPYPVVVPIESWRLCVA
jgi:hypothetical protein